jgi:hypothetical protein
VNGCSTVAVVLDIHTEEVVFEAACDGHFSETGFEYFKDLSDNDGAVMGYFHVVNIPGNGALGSIYGRIGNAWVIRVENEAAGGKDRGEQFVPQEAAHDAAINGFVALDVENLGVMFTFVDDEPS